MNSCSRSAAETENSARHGGDLNDRRLFRHPVGIFPPGARWYLASIAVIALVAVGLHLSIQQQAQQRTESLIRSWAAEAGIEIGTIRYHLLRNALVLQDCDYERDGERITIRHLLIRTRLSALNSDQARIDFAAISGLTAAITIPDSRHTPPAWLSYWQAINTLQVRDSSIALRTTENRTPLARFEQIQLDQRPLGALRKLNFSTAVAGGNIQGEWHGSISSLHSMQGWLNWHAIDAAMLHRDFQPGTASGTLSGRMQWHQDNKQSLKITGESRLHRKNHLGDPQLSKINWQGSTNSDESQLNLRARNWPVDTLSEYLPYPETHADQQTVLDGELVWRLTDAEPLIQGDAVTVRSSGPIQHHSRWQMEKIECRNFSLNPESNSFKAERIHLIRPTINLLNSENIDMPWHYDIDSVQISKMDIVLHTSDGEMVIRNLNGTLSAKSEAIENIRLRSGDSHWDISGNLTDPNKNPHAAFTITINNLPLHEIRPLLPFESEGKSAIEIEGTLSAALHAKLQQQQWHLAGNASATKVILGKPGERWSSEKVDLSFASMPGDPYRINSVQRMQANQWHYAAALQPLSAAVNSEQMETSWFNSSLQHWRIESLEWGGGSISVGALNSIWMHDTTLKLQQLTTTTAVDLSVVGTLGDGELKAEGRYAPLHSTQRFSGEVTLVDATPFFLNEWMQASNMPRPLRGRINGKLRLGSGEHEEEYRGGLTIKVSRPKLENAYLPDDPLLARTGFSTVDLINRLVEQGNISIDLPLAGSWRENLTTSISSQLLQHLKTSAASRLPSDRPEPVGKVETRIRLRDAGPLSLNERNRLARVMRMVRSDRHLVVDLRPHWGGQELATSTRIRMAKTSQLIERYLHHWGVDRGRIFALAPTDDDRGAEIPSIKVIVYRMESPQ